MRLRSIAFEASDIGIVRPRPPLAASGLESAVAAARLRGVFCSRRPLPALANGARRLRFRQRIPQVIDGRSAAWLLVHRCHEKRARALQRSPWLVTGVSPRGVGLEARCSGASSRTPRRNVSAHHRSQPVCNAVGATDVRPRTRSPSGDRIGSADGPARRSTPRPETLYGP